MIKEKEFLFDLYLEDFTIKSYLDLTISDIKEVFNFEIKMVSFSIDSRFDIGVNNLYDIILLSIAVQQPWYFPIDYISFFKIKENNEEYILTNSRTTNKIILNDSSIEFFVGERDKIKAEELLAKNNVEKFDVVTEIQNLPKNRIKDKNQVINLLKLHFPMN
jgi:hypothetical protein